MSPLLATSGPTAYWYLTRGTGVVSLLLLTATVVLGILDVQRYAAPRWPRFAVDRIHRDISLLVLAVLVVHIVTTVLDGFAPITLLDGVVPFASGYRPLWLGLGALAFDVLLAVAITSLVRRRLGYRAWRAVHWIAYASWPVALFHTLGTGTDASSVWLLALSAACTGVVVVATATRIFQARSERPVLRPAWLVLAAATPIGAAIFAVAGPLAPHWASRAGTPTAVLHKAHPAATRVALSTPPAAPAPSRPTKDSLSIPFTAPVSGTVSQTPASGGALVDLAMQVNGSIHGQMRVRLAGAPIPGGGLSLTGSDVEFTAPGLTSALRGKVNSLSGQSFIAHVSDRAGTALDLHLDLNIDDTTNTVTGTMRAAHVGALGK